MAMKLQTFSIKKIQRWNLIIFCSSNQLISALKGDSNYDPQVFFYIEKIVISHICDNLSDFSYSSGESDEEKINSLGCFL